MSLVKLIGYLPTAIVKKLTGGDKMAPLFIATWVENDDEEIEDAVEIEDVVELACGHILCKKDDIKGTGARFRLLGRNSLLANLSIFEATRCPFCESDLLADKDVGSGNDFGAAALSVGEKHMALDKERKLCGLERHSSVDEQSRQEREDLKLLELSADERLNWSLGETLIGAWGRAKKVLTVQSAGGSIFDVGEA